MFLQLFWSGFLGIPVRKTCFPLLYSAFPSRFLWLASGSSWYSTVHHLGYSLRKFLTRDDSLIGGHLPSNYVASGAIVFFGNILERACSNHISQQEVL